MSEAWSIPSSWAWASAADIATIVGGGTPDTQRADFFGGNIAWLTPADLSGHSAKHIESGARSLSEGGYRQSGAQLMPPGAVLFSSRAPIGYVAVASIPVCTNQGFKSFVPESGVSSDYLYYYLQRAKQLALRLASGTTFLEVSGKKIATLPVPIPPFAEQQRIAEKLDELLSDLDAGVAALERVQTKLKHYRAAVLNAAVDGVLQPYPPIFVETQLRTLINGLGQGWSPKCELTRNPLPDEWAIIKTTAVQSMRYSDCEAKPLPDGLTPRPHIEIRAGDMLMTRKGPRKRAGVTCLVRSTRHRLMVCDTVYRFRCNLELVEPAYLELALSSPRVVAAIDRKKSGINDSGVSLTHKKIGEIRIPLPPLAEQSVIVEAVEDQLSVIEHLEGDLEAKFKSSQALRQSILRRAFTGELVPQDPNDEPASELLKSIVIERKERARLAGAAKQANPRDRVPRGRDGKQ